MKNKIVSTTYAPLRPPYQIIKYNQDVAMQIGTLIVTVQKDGADYQIETHSHPVVAYENKGREEFANAQLTNHEVLEGAVWNHVEVKQVTTVCLAGATLTWKDFMEVLEHECLLGIYRDTPDVQMFWKLKKLGIKVLPPEEHECTIPLILHIQPEEVGLSLRPLDASPLFLNVSVAEDDFKTGKENVFYIREEQRWDSKEWKDDERVFQQFKYQLSYYSIVLREILFNERDARFNVTLTTEVERYKDVVKRLNEDESLNKLGFSR